MNANPVCHMCAIFLLLELQQVSCHFCEKTAEIQIGAQHDAGTPTAVLLRGDLWVAWFDIAAIGLDEVAGGFGGGFR